MHRLPLSYFLFISCLALAPLASACTSSSECDAADCVCTGTCMCLPGDELEEDYLDVRPLYTIDGVPVVVLRLDLEGTCLGSGEKTFIVYRETSLEIASDGIEVDDFRTPRHVPDSFAYDYADLSIEVRNIALTGVRLEFIDTTGTAETLRAECDASSSVVSCAEL